jgi:hypothetical protein
VFYRAANFSMRQRRFCPASSPHRHSSFSKYFCALLYILLPCTSASEDRIDLL